MLAKGDRLDARTASRPSSISPSRRRATPRRRLIKKMEELGIGRPSTYASTLTVLRDRDYVRLEKKRLIPEDKGRLVTAFLESFFERYVEYDFTADLEEKLDQISAGELAWKDVLRDFWREFSAAVARDQRPSRHRGAGCAERHARAAYLPAARADGGDPRACPSCGDRPARSSSASSAPSSAARTIPSAASPASSPIPATRRRRRSAATASALGTDPETGLEVTLRTGRFGPYVQLGEQRRGEAEARLDPQGLGPGRASISTHALALLALPREIGLHPGDRQADPGGLRPLRALRPA